MLCLILLLLLCPVAAQAQQSALTETARRNVLLRILRERRIPFEERTLFADYGGFGSSLHVSIPRSNDSKTEGTIDTLALGIPIFSGQETAPDDRLPFGFEAGIAFIERVLEEGSPLNVRVAFLGNEAAALPEDVRPPPHSGLRDLYALLEEPENAVLLYLDTPDAPESLIVHHGAEGFLTALNVVKPFYESFHNLPASLAVRFNELYKLSLVRGHPVMRFALNRNLNALYVTGKSASGSPRLGRLKDGEPLSAPAAAAALTDYARNLAVSADNLDYHFLVISCFGRYFFIPEIAAVQAFLAVIGLFLLGYIIYGMILRNRLKLQWKRFIPYLWIYPATLIALVLALEIAGAIVSVASADFEGSPLADGFGWAFFKLLVAVILLSLLFSFWNRVSIPEKASFYGNGAVMLIAFGVCIAAVQDITFIPVFIGVLLFVLLGAIIPFPIPVYCCALMTPVMSLGPLVNLLQLHQGSLFFSAGRLTEIILSKNILTSLYIAVITLPFVLLIERGIALMKKNSDSVKKRRRLFPVLTAFALTLGSLALYGYRIKRIPYHAPVRRSIDASEAVLRIDLDYVTFLERRNIHIDLEAQGRPVSFNLYLDTADGTPPVIYAASMPFTFIDDRRSAAFTLGEGPPNPFSTDIVLPLSFSGFLRIEALYTLWDSAIDTLPKPESSDYILKVAKTIDLRNKN
jgi:hypothetical protein